MPQRVTQTFACSFVSAPQCVMSTDVYLSFYDPPLPPFFGHIEQDGVEGPTIDSEIVNFGEEIESGVTVLVDICNTWFVRTPVMPFNLKCQDCIHV